MRQLSRLRSAVILFMTMAMGALASPVAAHDSKAILVLHSLGLDSPGRFPFDSAFERAVRAGADVELYFETLDPNRSGSELLTQTREYLREKYDGKNIAAVAVVYDEALAFLLDERDPLFPTVPVAAVLLRRPLSLPERVSVILVGESISLALKLNSKARQIAIIDGAPPGGGGGNALHNEIQDQNVRFRELSLWDRYRWYVVGVTSLTLFQSGLIAGLMMQRARRRRREQALRESEQHFRVIADTAPVLIWRSGTDKTCDFFNKPWLDFRGRTLEQEAGSSWMDGLHPDDRASSIHTYVEAFESREPFRMEYRLHRADGEYRWVMHIGVPRYDATGQFAGYIGSAIDITERKQIEQQNRDLAGRLLHAQEEERTRIARDLHDDVSQQLAGLAIILSGLKRKVGKRGAEPEIDGTITTLQERTSALAHAIRNLSHELHPSVLEHVGLVVTLQRHCADLETHHHLKVIFSAGDQLDSLSPEVALCLFRVAQEALTNVVRHARAHTIHVQLRATNEGIELRVDDDGIGFVVSERIGGGLGLRSIGERVRLNRGHLSVESRPGRGTNLLVRIPQPAAEAELGRVS